MTELELLKSKLMDTQKAIIKEQKKTSWAKTAEEFHDIYKAFIDAGFSDEQAWYLTGTVFNKALEKAK